MDSETAKLKERDEKYAEQVQEWRGSLGPRKKVKHRMFPCVGADEMMFI